MSNLTVINGPDFRQDPVKALRAIADDIEAGDVPAPDVLAITAYTAGEKSTLWGVGRLASSMMVLSTLDLGRVIAIDAINTEDN